MTRFSLKKPQKLCFLTLLDHFDIIFLQKNLAVTYNYIWTPNTILNFIRRRMDERIDLIS